MLDSFELKEQFEGMVIRPTAVFAAVIRQHGFYPYGVLFEERQHIVIQDMDSGDRHLARVQPAKSKTAEAVDDGLQINLADAFERADKERVYRNQFAGVMHLNLPLSELRAKAFQQANLLIIELQCAVLLLALQSQQTVMLGQQVMPAPDASNAA